MHARIEPNGEVSVLASSPRTGSMQAPVLAAVVHCAGRIKSDDVFGDFGCHDVVRREGLSLSAVVDLVSDRANACLGLGTKFSSGWSILAWALQPRPSR